jgi:protein-S-isoprenylcysteine O-methyltransferase Ste14
MSAALAVLVVLAWGAVFVCRVEPLGRALPAYGRAERFWVLFTPAVLTLHFAVFCVSVTTGAQVGFWRGLGGAALFAGGVGFWFWGRTAIGPVRLQRVPEDPPLRFRRDGPFAIVRNPLALGVLVAAAAPLVAQPDPVFAVTFTAGAAGLAVRTGQEERRMRAQLGSVYAEYCRDVKRLLPFLW